MHLRRKKFGLEASDHVIERALNGLFPPEWLRAKARETSVVQRHHDPAEGALVRFTGLRWANAFAENADALMGWVLDHADVAHGFEEKLAVYEVQGLDPNVHRKRLMDGVWG